MSFQTEKIRLAKQLLATEDPKIIAAIKKLFKQEKTADFWDELSIKQKEEIEKALIEIKNDEVTDYDSFMEKYR